MNDGHTARSARSAARAAAWRTGTGRSSRAPGRAAWIRLALCTSTATPQQGDGYRRSRGHCAGRCGAGRERCRLDPLFLDVGPRRIKPYRTRTDNRASRYDRRQPRAVHRHLPADGRQQPSGKDIIRAWGRRGRPAGMRQCRSSSAIPRIGWGAFSPLLTATRMLTRTSAGRFSASLTTAII